MENEQTLKQILQSLNDGVALVDSDDWSIAFENAKFFQWFPPAGEEEELLTTRLPGFDPERAEKRLSAGRPYKFEIEIGEPPRTTPLNIELKPLHDDGGACVLVQCDDISKQKEKEYMLESYSKMSERNARDLEKEKDRVEKLLLNIMPRSVYDEMKDYGTTTPQKFDAASVLMLDFVDFTDMAISRDPTSLISELNDIFSAFDRIVELFGCERIKTIGDAYMAVSGMPEPTPDHTYNIAKVALRLKRYLERRNAAHPEQWVCRIGINTGPLIGSIVGIQKYVYDIFGPGVNLAARMEGFAEPMGITMCEETFDLIRDDFACTDLGEHEVKGFGIKRLYSLDAEHPKLR
ncbi:MAG: adenylate/guanylate cyclase domain-containing protein [Rhodospirillales bacterium]|nr:adenylate/guanylate cyclase domain-containing protein [Rhodospirillales bacterium]